ncbi:hypothetical protein M2454_001097 [Aequitasia blattaphilus]|uniref:Uncharacterized protein n=1 Tax=Aequitasia blattaphilus TaxID=2949332 RepID=A0ABT1EA27_9FIRM|nr:hypothetical protein [Aequitasia blattaphilus]MCP1101362.1 hypothetical protein [Aequitasia blattaphilus]MCR8614002.1 hypothetical protein [Aequitasia blattaphilus]
MKRLKILILLIAAVIFSFFYAHIEKKHAVYNDNLEENTFLTTGVLSGQMEQTFISKEDAIDGVSVKLQHVGDVSKTTIHFTLLDTESGDVLGENTLKGIDTENNKFNKIPFSSIKGVKGRNLTLVIRGENEDDKNGLSFVYHTQQEENTTFILGEEKIEGTLFLRTLVKMFDIETFVILLVFIAYIVGFMSFLYKLFK